MGRTWKKGSKKRKGGGNERRNCRQKKRNYGESTEGQKGWEHRSAVTKWEQPLGKRIKGLEKKEGKK